MAAAVSSLSRRLVAGLGASRAALASVTFLFLQWAKDGFHCESVCVRTIVYTAKNWGTLIESYLLILVWVGGTLSAGLDGLSLRARSGRRSRVLPWSCQYQFVQDAGKDLDCTHLFRLGAALALSLDSLALLTRGRRCLLQRCVNVEACNFGMSRILTLFCSALPRLLASLVFFSAALVPEDVGAWMFHG